MKREFTWHKVEADEWFTTIREKLNAGFTYFDFLTGVDREIADSQLRTEVITRQARPLGLDICSYMCQRGTGFNL
jgi:hypothetical protein